jgi:hypothetical protein
VALNAVLHYLQGVVNGIEIPGSTNTLTTYIVPPVQVPLNGPIALLLPGPAHGARRTAPRGAAHIEVPWWIDLLLKFETNANTANLDQQLALIVDAILYACWATPMPIPITDPTTQRVSSVMAIGEEFEVDPQPPETPASMRSLVFSATVRIEVKEWIQA